MIDQYICSEKSSCHIHLPCVLPHVRFSHGSWHLCREIEIQIKLRILNRSWFSFRFVSTNHFSQMGVQTHLIRTFTWWNHLFPWTCHIRVSMNSFIDHFPLMQLHSIPHRFPFLIQILIIGTSPFPRAKEARTHDAWRVRVRGDSATGNVDLSNESIKASFACEFERKYFIFAIVIWRLPLPWIGFLTLKSWSFKNVWSRNIHSSM